MNYLATPQPRRDRYKSGRGVAFRSIGWPAALVAVAAVGAAVATYPAAAPAIAEELARVRFVPVRAESGGVGTLRHAAIAAWNAPNDGLPARAETRTASGFSALRDWAATKPEAAVAWARERHGDSPVAAVLPGLADPTECDIAATAFGCATDASTRSTTTTLGWAEAIADPALRQCALAHVFQDVAQQDAAAAVRYIDNAPRLNAAERDALLAAIRPRASSADV